MQKFLSGSLEGDEFSKKTWIRYEASDVIDIEALLFPEERKIMAWMAQHIYTGDGEIVDAGAFLGGSAACFGLGLSRNTKVQRKDGRIHSYDLFRKGNWLPSSVPSWDPKEDGETTLDVFHNQIAQYEHMISVHPGDIRKRNWNGGRIELLMLDCSKTQELNDHCMRIFMPSMIPDRSYLIHQDYAVRSAMYWLHSTMYLLRDHFEHLATVKFGGTTIFRCKKAITPEVIEGVIYDQNSEPDKLVEGAIEYAKWLKDEKIMTAIKASHEARGK